MTGRTVQKEAKPQVPVAVFVACVILLLALVGWIGWRNFGPRPLGPVTPKSENHLRMDRIYQQSGGDLAKLSPEDRAWLHEYSHGHEQEAFGWYKGQSQGPGR
jgi:hypothetical protein